MPASRTALVVFLTAALLGAGQPVTAAAPAVAAWTGTIIQGGLTDLSGHILARFYDEYVAPETVVEAQAQVEALSAAVEAAEGNPDAGVSPQALALVETQLNHLKTVLSALSGEAAEGQRRLAEEVAALRIFVEAQGRTAPRPPMGVEAAYLVRDQGKGEMRPLFDGGGMRTGDHYKIVFTPRENGYVYLFQTDSSGKVYRLFPMAGMKGVRADQFNPVRAGMTYTLPAEDKSFLLDDQTGEERFYLIASKKRDAALEEAFEKQEAAPDGPVRAAASAALAQTIKSRGPAGIVQDPKVEMRRVAWDDGHSGAVTPGLLEGRCGVPGGCVQVLRFTHH